MYDICVLVLASASMCLGQTRGPPMVETKPNLLDSFIPAGMQIIAHLTEEMKYDLKPTPSGATTTTTTLRPTKPHHPGVFAPDAPPGPEAYFARSSSYDEYVERLKQPSGYNYFDRYRYPVEEEGRSLDNIPQDIEAILDKRLIDLLRLVSTDEDVEAPEDQDRQVAEFARNYDDSDVRSLLVRQKKKPPTRAYVSLLSLYDLLNKESKKQGLNKYTGYSQNVLSKLAETSTGTSSNQLKAVLSNIVQRKETKSPQIIKKINELVKDLGENSSYINAALRYISPLPFNL